MPKPYKGSGWGFGLETLRERPQLAMHIGVIITMWTQIELQLGILLSLILHDDAQIATAMYMRIKSEAARLAAIEAVAEEKLTENLLEDYATLMKHVKNTGSQRDKVAHSIWAIPHDRPECLLLIDPRKQIAQFSAGASLMAKEAKGQPQTPSDKYWKIAADHHSSILEYAESDFVEIETRIIALMNEIYAFSGKVMKTHS